MTDYVSEVSEAEIGNKNLLRREQAARMKLVTSLSESLAMRVTGKPDRSPKQSARFIAQGLAVFVPLLRSVPLLPENHEMRGRKHR